MCTGFTVRCGMPEQATVRSIICSTALLHTTHSTSRQQATQSISSAVQKRGSRSWRSELCPRKAASRHHMCQGHHMGRRRCECRTAVTRALKPSASYADPDSLQYLDHDKPGKSRLIQAAQERSPFHLEFSCCRGRWHCCRHISPLGRTRPRWHGRSACTQHRISLLWGSLVVEARGFLVRYAARCALSTSTVFACLYAVTFECTQVTSLQCNYT